MCIPCSQNYNVSKTYCAEHNENAFIDSQMAVNPVALVGPLENAEVLALAVKNYAKQTIAYMGTETGEMVEVSGANNFLGKNEA